MKEMIQMLFLQYHPLNPFAPTHLPPVLGGRAPERLHGLPPIRGVRGLHLPPPEERLRAEVEHQVADDVVLLRVKAYGIGFKERK